jgi:hypothetical protein
MLSLVPDIEGKDLFWTGQSRFQVSPRVLSFRGRAESLVLVYLFQLANSYSNSRIKIALIELRVKGDTIAKKCGLSPRAVYSALATLQAAGCIRIVKSRDSLTKLDTTSIYLLLRSEDGQPMWTTGGNDAYGICAANFEKPYVTLLKNTLEILVQMTPAARAVYLSAMGLASVRVKTSFGIRKEDWMKESLLGRNAFGRGKLECERRNLLTYSTKKQILTLNDPLTGKPNARTAHERIEHENPVWRILDLNTVPPDVWKLTIERVMRREFYVDHSGWTVAGKDVFCPFCKKARGFSVNYVKAAFKCYDCKEHGKLCQLVAKVLRVKMKTAKRYIAEQMPPQESAEPIAI